MVRNQGKKVSFSLPSSSCSYFSSFPFSYLYSFTFSSISYIIFLFLIFFLLSNEFLFTSAVDNKAVVEKTCTAVKQACTLKVKKGEKAIFTCPNAKPNPLIGALDSNGKPIILLATNLSPTKEGDTYTMMVNTDLKFVIAFTCSVSDPDVVFTNPGIAIDGSRSTNSLEDTKKYNRYSLRIFINTDNRNALFTDK